MCQNHDLQFLLFYYLFIKFFHVPFHFFDLTFCRIFFFFDLIFYRHLFSLFSLLFYPCFFSHVVLSLAYPNLLKNKRLGCWLVWTLIPSLLNLSLLCPRLDVNPMNHNVTIRQHPLRNLTSSGLHV
jgi:hypothetical protein